jgi:ATP-dependent RNA helicase DeaD
LVATIDRLVADETGVSFADLRLSPTTLQALHRMNIVTPTPIQAAALPALLDGRDLIGQARTGSGKTLAFGIPAVEFVDPRQRHVQVLVLTPTRELAVQVGGVLDQVGAGRGVTVGLIFGGRPLGPQRELLRRGVHVVVGTPGRVLDLLNQGALWLDKIRLLVLDEADEMLDQGFAPDVERILARATSARQTVLFSATVPNWVQTTAAKHLNDPVSIKVDPKPEDAAPIPHVAYDVPNGDKLSALKDLLDHRGEGSMIVFGRTKHGVKKLAKQLGAIGYPVAALQGNLSQNARDKVMEDFRSGEVPVLLATNVAARGLDVSHVAAVVNMELPESPELLTHRVGRTGRMGRRGQAITLLGPDDGPKWRQLQRGLGRQIPRVAWKGARAALDTDLGDLETAILIEPATRANGRPAARPAALSVPVARPARPAGERSVDAAYGRSERMGRTGSPAGERRLSQSVRRGTPADVVNGRGRPVSKVPVQINTRGDSSPARPNERAVRIDSNGDPLADTKVENPRGLLARYGRDPRRVTWERDRHEGERDRVDRTLRDVTRGRAQGGERDVARHEIVCSGCGQESQVPFRPDPSRPVYCSDCFRSRGRGARRPAELARA